MALSMLDMVGMAPSAVRTAAAPQRARPDDLTPEQVNSLLGRVTGGVMSGLEYAAETLDKPGRALRGVATGRLQDLANLIPFSDTMGLTDPNESVTGRQMLEKFGILGENQVGRLDMGDVAGLVTEMVFDPLNLLLGPGKALTKGATASIKAGKVLGATPTQVIDEIAEGSRGLVGLKHPARAILGDRISKAIGVGNDELTLLGTGKAGAKAYEAAYYNPAIRALRSAFSANPYIKVKGQALGHYGKTEQMVADDAWASLKADQSQFTTLAAGLQTRVRALEPLLDQHIKAEIERYPELNEIIGGNPSVELGNIGSDEFVRMLGERQKVGTLRGFLDSASTAGPQAPPANLDELSQAALGAADQFDAVVRDVLDFKDSIYEAAKHEGFPVHELLDTEAGHLPRRLSARLRRYFSSDAAGSSPRAKWAGELARDDALKNVNGNTFVLNRISRDPNITGIGFDSQDALDASAARIEHLYGIADPEKAQELAAKMASLPPQTAEEGLFSNRTIDDTLDYAIGLARARAAMRGTHHLASKLATEAADGVPVREAYESLFPRVTPKATDEAIEAAEEAGESLDTPPILERFKEAYARVSGKSVDEIDIDKLTVPQEFVDNASKMLAFNIKGKPVNKVLDAWDKTQRAFKAMLYLPFPASRTRDFVGDMWRSVVDTGSTPEYRLALRAMRGADDSIQYLDEARLAGLLDQSVLDDLRNRPAGIGTTAPSGGFGEQLKDAARSFDPREIKAPGLSRKGLKDWLVDTENPLNPFNIQGVRDGLEEGSTFAPVRAGEIAARAVDQLSKLAHFIALRKQGVDVGNAGRRVRTALYDYSELGGFDQIVMKRAVPFWSFARLNMPAQLRLLIDDPGGLTSDTIRAYDTLRDEGESDRQFVPQWLSQGLVIPMGDTPTGRRYFTTTGLLPFEEAFSRLHFRDGWLDVKRTLESGAAMLNPVAQLPLQQIADRQFWSHRSLDNVYPYPTDSEPLNALLYATPASRVISTVRTAIDERKSIPARALNLLFGGARITDVDSAALNREAREMLLDEIAGTPGVGIYRSAYGRDGASEETGQKLALYKHLTQEARRAKKAQPAK